MLLMRERPSRLSCLLLTLVVTAATLSACTPDPLLGDTVDVSADDAVRARSDDGGVTVSIPKGAVEGSGTLTITAVATEENATGWAIDLSGGATLVGEAVLTFADETGSDEETPVPLVTYGEPGSAATGVATAVSRSPGGVEVRTTHFSAWFITWWEDVASLMEARLSSIFAAAGKQPSCDREQEVRDRGFSVTSDDGDRVRWCLGESEDASPELDVVNGRGYAVSVESTPGLVERDTNLESVTGSVEEFLAGAPSAPQNSVALVGPDENVVYALSGSQPSGVKVTPSAGGYLATAGLFAVETVGFVLSHGGATGKAATAAKLFDWAACFAGAADMMSADVSDATAAATYLERAIATTLGCAREAIKRAGLDFWAVAFVGALSWLLSGVHAFFTGLRGGIDTLADSDGYQIRVSPPPVEHDRASSVTDETVGSLLVPAGACVGWEGSRPIQLTDGQGESFGPENGTGILATRLIGAADLTDDGVDDAVLIVECTGTPAAECCAGRGSVLSTVVALDLAGATPSLIGNPFTGGPLASSAGDIEAAIFDTDDKSPRLDGTQIVTWEGPLYDLDAVEDVSGWFRYTLADGAWSRMKE